MADFYLLPKSQVSNVMLILTSLLVDRYKLIFIIKFIFFLAKLLPFI